MSNSLWQRLSRRWGRHNKPTPHLHQYAQGSADAAAIDPRKALECKVLLLDNTDLTLLVPVPFLTPLIPLHFVGGPNPLVSWG